MQQILIVDDDEKLRQSLCELLDRVTEHLKPQTVYRP